MERNRKIFSNWAEYVRVVRSHLGLWGWLHRRRLESRIRGVVAPFVPIP